MGLCRGRHLLAAALALAGCAPAEEPAPDAPPPATTACAVGETTSDAGCVPPGIHACAPGFVADAPGSCAPVLAATCPDGTFAVPGESSCNEVAPCPDAIYGDAPADAIHVDGAYAGTSDGSAAQPFTHIQAAIDAAAPGATVAIAAGSYAEDLVLGDKPVVLHGRCPRLVEVVGSGAGTAAIFVRAGAHGTVVRNLAVTGARYGVATSGANDVVLERLWIHHAGERGVAVEDALGPGSVTLRRSLVESNEDIGVSVFGATLTIVESAVRETLEGRGYGRGVAARHGATLAISASVIEDNLDHGLRVSGSSATVDTTVIRRTLPSYAGFGGGVSVAVDADTLLPSTAVLQDVVVTQNQLYGVIAEGSHLELVRAVVTETQPQAAALDFGVGVQVQSTGGAMPADARIEESFIARNHYAGVAAAGATVALATSVVRDQIPEPKSGEYGRGLLLFTDVAGAPTSATVTACVFEGNHEAAVFGQGVSLTLDNVAIRDTHPLDGMHGRAIDMQSNGPLEPSELHARRLFISGSHDVGILIEGTTASVEDAEIHDTLPQIDGRFGDAIEVVTFPDLPAAEATFTAVRAFDSGRVGLVTFGALARVKDSQFVCNAIDLHGEAVGAAPFVLEDLGGNRCGCGEESPECQLIGGELEPPQPL
jgi:hypothetical protein